MLVAPYKANMNTSPAITTASGVEEYSKNTSTSVYGSGLCLTKLNAVFLPCRYNAEAISQLLTCCYDYSHCPTHIRRMILQSDRPLLSVLRMDISSKIERGRGANSNFKYEATSSSDFATQKYDPAEELDGVARRDANVLQTSLFIDSVPIATAASQFFFFRVLHTIVFHLRAHAFARSVTVAWSSAVQASSST